jgi:CheY-like chemotaxis protein
MDQAIQASIMVIGDDSHFCYLMRRYVRESAHQVVFANLDNDAQELARHSKPVAIILQVDLPGTRGWQVLRAIKADQTTSNIPIVLCSWLDEAQRGLDEGGAIYLRMPILYQDFEAALANLNIIRQYDQSAPSGPV